MMRLQINILSFTSLIIKLLIFDIRQMIKTMLISSPDRKNQVVLNERDIVNAIQLCPQIIKQDKLFLRNKIKQFFREFQPGDTQHTEFTQLLQIFSQCRKPLTRIHLYENHSHWLQVKLRKYITNQRKKLKQHCLNQFKRQKCEQKTKKNIIEKRMKYEDSCQKDSRKKLCGSLHSSEIKCHNSFEYKNIQSPKNFYDIKKFNQTCRNYQPMASSTSPTHGLGTKFAFPQTCKNFYNNQKQNPGCFKAKTNRSTSKNNCSSKSKNKKIFQQKKTYENFKKTFNQQKNVKRQQKQNQKNRMISSTELQQKLKFSQYPFFFSNISNQSHIPGQVDNKRSKLSYIEESTHKKEEDMSFDNFQPYQYKPKIQNLARCEGLSSIRQVKQYQQLIRQNPQIVSNFHERSSNENLFTSPELLEQCRKFIKKSQNQNKNIYQNRSLVENIRTQEEIILNTYSTENIFDQIECYEYHSPQFNRQKERYKNMKELLKDLFKRNWKIQLSNEQKQQVIERSPYGYEELVVLLVNQMNPKTKLVSFLDLLPLLKTSINITFSFSNIFLLLDVDSKGIVTDSDYECFIENFVECPIQTHILNSLKQKLFRFKSVVKEIFKEQKIVAGCFEYLELIDNKQIFELGQVLQMFQFQIDGDSKSQSNDKYQFESPS